MYLVSGISGEPLYAAMASASKEWLDASSKLDASASSEFYSTSNPSGFLTAHQSLAGYATEAYVDSSVSSKLDTTAFSTVSGDFLTSHQSLAGYATESYVDSAVSGKLDVTASSQFLTSLPDDLAYTSDVASAVSGKLDASASSDFYPMTSNPSGYLTAHQSLAGYATESYVDSAVSGKLDATAYDSAKFYTTANESGFIDAASASSIASAYAESAASSKLDSTASSSFYPSDNPSGFISGVDLSDYATTAYVDSSLSGKLDTTAQVVTSIGVAAGALSSINGYGLSAGLANSAGTATVWLGASSKLDASAASDFALTAQLEDYLEKTASSQFLTAVPDGYATTEYVDSSISGFAYESAVSGWTAKQDKLTFGYNTADQISSIDGSALGGMDEAAVSAIASAYAESAASGKQDTLTFGYDAEDKISGINGSSLAGGEQVVTSLQYATSQSGAIIGYTTGDQVAEKVFSARYYPNQGWYNYQSATALASVGFTALDSNITGDIEYPFEIFMIPYGTTNYGNIDYISSVGYYMSNYGQFNNTSDFRIATGMATLSGYSAILDFNVTSLPFNTQHGSPMWGTGGGMVLDETENSKPVFTVVYGSGSYREGRCARIVDGSKTLGFGAITTVSAVSGINELGIAGGAGGGIDSATCSAIASAYAESAVSSKADSSALSSYALSADVSGTVDLVSSQSANWGGSALALSAGPGVTLTKSGNTLIASTDETVLFSGSNSGMVATNLSEPLSSFNSFKICFNPFGAGMSREWKEFSWYGSADAYTVATFHHTGSDNLAWFAAFQPNSNGTTLTPTVNKLWVLGSTTVQDRTQMHVYRVIGINRTAEA